MSPKKKFMKSVVDASLKVNGRSTWQRCFACRKRKGTIQTNQGLLCHACAAKAQKPDVAHQKHYEELPVQPMEVILQVLTPDEIRGFLKASIIKYTIRAGHKAGTDDGEKAKVYRKWLWEYESSGEIEQFNVK
jgi:hypothetical protein